MPWIKVKVRKVVVPEELEELGLQPKNKEYEWVVKAIRTEDIAEFEQRNSKTVIYFHAEQERKAIIIFEDFDSFFKKMYDLDDINAEVKDETSQTEV